ncbi:uncharacterized protein B0H18DRAFT_1207244 [Fomitopsis serialis]|uniref:uncharacterized protein n=1 Tax=Fomitopsis serialis TaxID=139415 RepID=UPI00200826F7|nr:uncharacterized protein B0H18DRAFT_1207244 [Neoantrodia serialis]KAH9935690.1 hypothetical protein B0H18DRAFT_1207244 [Neoantrodia serialis]
MDGQSKSRIFRDSHSSQAEACSKRRWTSGTDRPAQDKVLNTPYLTPRAHTPLETSSLDFWERTLSRTYDNLCPTPDAKRSDGIRIAVYGCDELSGARDLVAALLEEPFASEAQRKAVRSRWEAQTGSKGPIIIENAANANGDSTLRVQSAWLQQFGAPIKVLEFDVCNPASTPVHTVLSGSETVLPLTHPNAVLVLTSTSGDERLAERLRDSFGHELTVLFVDPARALQGLRTLSASPSSSSAVQKYQDDFAGSNVPHLTQAILQTIPQLGAPAKVLEVVHVETARAVVQDVLSACDSELGRAQGEVNVVCDGISSLRAQMEEVRVRIPREVLGGDEDGNEVQRAVDQSRKDTKVVLERLTWWKLLWKVDDVGDIVMDAVNRAWRRDLEYRLVFHAGRLAFLQRSFVDSATSFTASFKPSSAFHSPVLQNQLSQISSSPTFPMDSTAFLLPLYTRRQQLRFPTARLQTTAQRVLIGMSSSVLGGAGVAWAGWAGQLGIIDMAMQTETVIGMGMLGAAAGVRWAVGRFERAKSKWLKDYDRVGEGLERDLRATLERTVNDGCSSFQRRLAMDGQAVSKRKEEIEELKEEVGVLEDELSRTHQ